MVYLGFEPEAAGWKAQTNPLSYSSTAKKTFLYVISGQLKRKILAIFTNMQLGNGSLQSFMERAQDFVAEKYWGYGN